jgi:trk system potassium uptake protein TrkH
MLRVAHVLGTLLALFGLTYLLPFICSVFTGDGQWPMFLLAALVSSGAGLALSLSTRFFRQDLKPRDGFLLVTLGWVLISASATLPLLLGVPGLSFTRAFFEAMSGLTTTGITTLTGLDALPPSLNFWRCCLQWFGGLGLIVMALAVLPLLGIGGMQLYRAEAPSPTKDEKLAPRITATAKSLWLVYALITAAGVLGLRLCGMSWLDAICHSFSAVALGGFSTHDRNIGYFNSPAVEVVLMVLMVIASFNFSRHFMALRRLSFDTYRADPEIKAILLVLTASVLVVTLVLRNAGVAQSFTTALRYASFNVISVATTAGFWTQDYAQWPVFAPFWMLFLSCILSSSGSTGGGITMFRTLLLARQAGRELKLLVHPSAVTPVRVGGKVVPDRIADAVLGYIFLYFMTGALLTFSLLLTGLGFESSFSAVVASLNNTAAGLASVGPTRTYHDLSDVQIWVCTAAMLLGRLEIFSVIVLFTPAFWRK